ncbi:penicillin-binding protein 2 [Sphingomonas flavalba]|uniref:penicillin-binding protein 2 n=1 Tax=Sphingomonas flavalba TaxID=2559804 RepID=UPI00109D8D58|nr:penicillin-binding protein 2 [Sphingomonas flavalba]
MKLFGKRVITDATQGFVFTRRALVLGAAQGGVGLLLAGRMAWLSVVENERYSLLSESNRVNLTLVPPRRGWIVDRTGKPIAINRTDFRVDLIPERLTDRDKTLAAVQRLLALSDDEMQRIREELDGAAGFQPVQIAENLDWNRYAAVSVRLNDLPGIMPGRGFSRFYPDGAAVGHLVGYVGPASAAEYEKAKDPLLITPGFKVGKEGLEKTLEPALRGKPGAKRVEVTAHGKIVRELTTRPDISGGTVRLTIDAGLQAYAARRLGTASGSVVVIDCANGDILAMASMPAYDPNSFSDGISHDEWDMLSQDDHLPLLNKVLQGLYPPGSTVKPMNALALLEAGVGPQETVLCTGAYRVGSGLFHCHKRGGHGMVDMRRAVAQSCDVYFYHMARRLGYDPIARMARLVGLGERYDLPVASQRYGTVPDSAWKKAKYNRDWTAADTVNASIGQGYMLTNPLQLAVMAARIGSGRMFAPRLLATSAPPAAATLPVPAEHLAIVHDAMDAVVNGGGTGGRARLQVPGVLMAGKTGTAQVRRITLAERRTGVLGDAALPFRLRDHSLFIGFAPADVPRYAVSCILEHSGHIVTAAPIASDVVSYLFDKDKALARLERLEAEWGGTIAQRMAAQARAFRAARHPAAAVPDPAEEDAR